jgi:hypothetical protein
MGEIGKRLAQFLQIVQLGWGLCIGHCEQFAAQIHAVVASMAADPPFCQFSLKDSSTLGRLFNIVVLFAFKFL